MNTLARVLKTPWIATIRSTHGYLMLAVWFLLAADLSKALPVHGGGARFGITVLLLTVATAWKMVVNTLWLARDARTLCLPGITRDANAVPLYAALASVVLPATVLGLVFGHTALWLVSLALVAAGTVGFLLLPTLLSMPVFLAGLFYAMFSGRVPLPGMPGYLAWALPVLATLALVAMQRWNALMHATSIAGGYWWRPTNLGGRSLQLRRLHGARRGSWVLDAFGANDSSGSRPAAGLRNVGPEHPVRSLRVALSQHLVPFDTRVDAGRYWYWRAALATSVLVPPVIALLAERHFGIEAILRVSPQILFFAAMFLTLASMQDRAVDEAWYGPRADLSLVALLPGMDRRGDAHRNTLAACVAGNLQAKAWFTYSWLMLFAVLRLPAMFFVYLALMLATGVAMQFATTTGSLCARRGHGVTGFASYAIVMLVAAIPTMTWGVRVTGVAHPELATLGAPALACVGLWLACCAAFAGIAVANWRRFAARPHPFLTHPSA